METFRQVGGVVSFALGALFSSLAFAGESCEIKAYMGVDEYGYISPTDRPELVIEVNRSTGMGKIYKADSFGNKSIFEGELGTVRQNGSGDLELFLDSRHNVLSRSSLRPVAVIKKPEELNLDPVFTDSDCTGDADMEDPVLDLSEKKPLDSPVRTEIYSVDQFGQKSWQEIGTALIDCE